MVGTRVVPEGAVFVTVKGAGVGTVFPGVVAVIGRGIYAFVPEMAGLGIKDTSIFSALTVFQILDSNAQEALELKNLGSSSRNYHRFSSCFRDVLLANSEALAAARIADACESPTDLNLG